MIKIKNISTTQSEFVLDGNSQFEALINVMDSKSDEPYKLYSFKISALDIQNIVILKKDNVIEMLAEKIKQDFIIFVKDDIMPKENKIKTAIITDINNYKEVKN